MKSLYFIIAIIALTACQSTRQFRSLGASEKQQIYFSQSVEDAAVPLPSEISNKLWAVNAADTNLIWKEMNGNRYVKTVTWKSGKIAGYWPKEGAYNTGAYENWVTLAPQMMERVAKFKFKTQSEVERRLEQLIGLPPNNGKEVFIEIWVQPKDLYRPCPDPEINDMACGLCFSVAADSSHQAWINSLRISSFYPPKDDCDFTGYPWTQLGYTYDWNPYNKSHVGLSEFILRPNADVIVARQDSTYQYLNLAKMGISPSK